MQRSLKYINDGYQDIVDIDLKSFFDEVQHYKLLQLIYNKVKCETTLWLIRKWLRAPILVKGKLQQRRKRAVRKKIIQWIFLALGQLEGWEIDVVYIEEKSAEVIVPTGKRAVKSRGLTKLGRTERIVK